MVFESFGVVLAESELREQCDCTPLYGTDALAAVDLARSLGFLQTAKYTLSLTGLAELIADGHHPIVYVILRPIDGVNDPHAFVVIGLNESEVTVLDPLKGERSIPVQNFIDAWAMKHNLAILVSR